MVVASSSPTQNPSDLAELLHQAGTMSPDESVGEECVGDTKSIYIGKQHKPLPIVAYLTA